MIKMSYHFKDVEKHLWSRQHGRVYYEQFSAFLKQNPSFDVNAPCLGYPEDRSLIARVLLMKPSVKNEYFNECLKHVLLVCINAGADLNTPIPRSKEYKLKEEGYPICLFAICAALDSGNMTLVYFIWSTMKKKNVELNMMPIVSGSQPPLKRHLVQPSFLFLAINRRSGLPKTGPPNNFYEFFLEQGIDPSLRNKDDLTALKYMDKVKNGKEDKLTTKIQQQHITSYKSALRKYSNHIRFITQKMTCLIGDIVAIIVFYLVEEFKYP